MSITSATMAAKLKIVASKLVCWQRHVGMWAGKHARHVGIWAQKHAKHIGMWPCKHPGHVGTWACKAHWHVSMQGMLAHEHVFSIQGTQFSRLIFLLVWIVLLCVCFVCVCVCVWYQIIVPTLTWYHTHIHTQRHTSHSGSSRLIHPYKYMFIPSVMWSQQLSLLYWMNNSLISKIYFPQCLFFSKLFTCKSHISVKRK